MHWYIKQKNGHREEIEPAEYLRAPVIEKGKFREALERVRKERELRETAKAGLKLMEKSDEY